MKECPTVQQQNAIVSTKKVKNGSTFLTFVHLIMLHSDTINFYWYEKNVFIRGLKNEISMRYQSIKEHEFQLMEMKFCRGKLRRDLTSLKFVGIRWLFCGKIMRDEIYYKKILREKQHIVKRVSLKSELKHNRNQQYLVNNEHNGLALSIITI